MTTYTITGIQVSYDNVTENAIAVSSPAILEVVVPDTTTSITYSILDIEPGDIPRVDINVIDYEVRLNGVTFDGAFEPTDSYLGFVDWSQSGAPRNSIILDLFFEGNPDDDYYFVIGGSPIPQFSTLSAWNAFEATVTGVGTATGSYATNTVIPFTTMGFTASEDDTVTGGAGDDTFLGGAGNDILRGGLGNDTLNGGAGNDILNGGSLSLSRSDGADAFIGGAGIDTVTYEGSAGSLRVDMIYTSASTFSATGDTFNSIENLIGSQGKDNLRGTQEDNVITGNSNVDYIYGRRGDDTLNGGVGDDVLFGGVGSDTLNGGIHRDRAQYSQSLTELTLDLLDASRNTGEGAGDVYNSIEDLAGSEYDDLIYGNNGANRLFGRGGDDRLTGRSGDDYLNGGGGRDTLLGGIGNDVLRGGASKDTFVFDSGQDVIEDFRADLLRLDDALWGNTSLSRAQILDFASVVAGDTVFDFGGGNTLTLENYTDIAGLETFISTF